MNIKPKVVLWENVKGVLDRNLRASFFHYLKEMERLGYENKYEILNAIEFGIPQKRERIFVVSILGTNHFNFGKLKKIQTRNISEFLEKDASNLYEVRQHYQMLIDLYKEKSLVKHLMEVQKRAIDFMRKEKPKMIEALETVTTLKLLMM